MTTSTLFEEAKQNEQSRHEFVRSIDLEYASPYIRAVVYSPIHYDIFHMYTSPSWLAARFYKTGTRSTITVYPRSFKNESIETFDDFLSVLIDHEGTHAQDIYRDPFSIPVKTHPLLSSTRNQRLIALASELRAYDNQMAMYHSGHRQISPLLQAEIEQRIQRTKKEQIELERDL